MKKVLAVFFVLGMFSVMFGQHVQSGDFKLTPSTPGYTLDKNEGDRIMTVEVSYEKPFEVKPDIVVTVNTIEANTGTTLRYQVTPTSISRDGFIIRVKTWGDSKIQQIGGSWIAVSGK